MRKPNEQLKLERREQLIAVAAELFATKSYHQVLMDEVAEKSGIAKGTVYNYFSTKEDLYISIITHRLKDLLSILRERIDTLQTPLINLRRILIHIYSFMAKYPHFFQIWYREKMNCQRDSHQEIHVLYQEIKDLLIVALEKGISDGILRPHTAPFIADIVLGIIDSAVLRSTRFSVEEQKKERLRMFGFIMDALGSDIGQQMHTRGLDEPQQEGLGVAVKG